MTKIVIASGNKGKINDFKAIFEDFDVVGIKEILKKQEQRSGRTQF